MKESWNVICTDRGGHEAKKLADLLPFSDDGVTCTEVTVLFNGVLRADNLPGHSRQDRAVFRAKELERWIDMAARVPGPQRVRFRCVTCGERNRKTGDNVRVRDVVINQARLVEVVNRSEKIDPTCREIDISYMG